MPCIIEFFHLLGLGVLYKEESESFYEQLEHNPVVNLHVRPVTSTTLHIWKKKYTYPHEGTEAILSTYKVKQNEKGNAYDFRKGGQVKEAPSAVRFYGIIYSRYKMVLALFLHTLHSVYLFFLLPTSLGISFIYFYTLLSLHLLFLFLLPLPSLYPHFRIFLSNTVCPHRLSEYNTGC